MAALIGVSHATTLAPIGFESQVQDSDAIIYGRVISKSSKIVPSKKGDVIVTLTKVESLETFSGSTSKIVELSSLGGTVNGVTMEVDGMPKLQPGEEYVLFVKDNGDTICPILGWSQGACKVSSEPDGMAFLSIPTLLTSEAHKALTAILEETRKATGPTSLAVAKLLLAEERVEKKFPSQSPFAPAAVTLDQFRDLVKHYSVRE